MLAFEAQLTAGEVLRAFHQDEPFLFLGAAFNTVTIILIGLCAIRRKADGMLLSLAWFAHLYGIRLWMDSNLLQMSVPGSEFFHRLIVAVNFLVPIPAFLYFHFAGFLGRMGRYVTPFFVVLFSCLVAATLAWGPLPIFDTANNSVIAVALLAVLVRTFRDRNKDRDSVVIRIGLLAFVAPAILENLALPVPRIEPYGFAVLLACLGYVAARRTLQRDREYSEIQQELELARRIQLSILPAAFPASRAFQVAAKYVPMTSVAGDLYDFLLADDDHAGLLIADVSGHGVPAALIASMVKMAATSQRAQAANPAALLAGMNSALCGNTQGQYVTAAYVYLDAEAGTLRYSAAGHPAMLLLRDGAVSEIVENGMLLAAVDNAFYDSKTVALKRGDRLLLYTDGLIEARNANGRLFGEASLQSELENTAKLAPEDAVEHLIDAVQRWAKSQDDDLTAMVCDFVADPALMAAD
jgi:sigma-B regulation protein RsbU (phosphoserine phosphatase)